ncbi:AraC family transcriptional regulator [Cupriavidus pauculus]|uniref:AraC family transcriptional regulator n=1 Tax=Cupriavidus pauculus TaxID=82633 RepID=A0A2N5C2Z0_9BURK|nr:AraC family transcriptional regulator [Cupriavidus pauculus]PLP96599.1 AraC family transcriptional regulator [Cupriavidus pauculus]
MRLSIESASHLRLARLVPAFPMTVTATRGTAVMRRNGFARTLVPGLPCIVEPFHGVDLLVTGCAGQPAGCRIEIAPASDTGDHRLLHRALSRRIFLQPDLPWSADFAAELLGESPRQIRRTLFAEGAAFGDLCRTQRLMRLLFESTHGHRGHASLGSLKRRMGWPASHDLESSFYDRFGITLDVLRHVTDGGDASPGTGARANPSARLVPPIAHYWPSLSPA